MIIDGLYPILGYNINYRFNENTKNLKIFDSYKITDIDTMLRFLLEHKHYLKLINRTVDSCINEWVAHNRLYKIGLYKNRCIDTDLTKNESKFRRFCYYLLSRYEVIKWKCF